MSGVRREEELKPAARVRAVIAHLAEVLRAERPRIEGTVSSSATGEAKGVIPGGRGRTR
jgi:hypothetical protein